MLSVLVACEFSGVVRDAFIRAGCKAVSCDLLPSESDLGEHYQGDVLDILNDGWDLLIAHPPCTYLSNAGARHLYSGHRLNLRRYNKGLQAKEFFMLLYNADIPFICLENPLPSKIYELPPFTQIVQPYYYGHPYSKKTLLWLKNLPCLQPTCWLTAYETTRKAAWFNSGSGAARARARARTFSGVAVAMAQQWSAYIEEVKK